MNQRIILFLTLISLSFLAVGQVDIEIKSKIYSSEERVLTLELKPIFGSDSIKLVSLFGEESTSLRPDTTSFFIEYENIPTEKMVKSIPSSIGVENLSKIVYPMPTPIYKPDEIDQKSTKSWKVTFSNVPEYAGCVKLNLVGKWLEIGDLASASESRIERLGKLKEERKKKIFLLFDINSPENDSLSKEIKNFIEEYLESNSNTNYVGKLTWTVDTLGVNKFALIDDTSKVEPLEIALKNKFSTKKLPLLSKLDLSVSYKAEFSILISSGTFLVNNAKGTPKYNPTIYNDEIKLFIKKKLTEKARFKATLKYASINGKPMKNSNVFVKKTFLNREQQNIFIFGLMAGIAIFTAALTVL